jgi:indolepyruvate ferredoxin oxidoreductase
MATDPRFLADSGREVFTGNELLIKGALEVEGGVHLLTGYPGSPVAGFFDTLGDIKDLLNSHGVRAFQANNEALGVAAVNGSQMLPCRAIATMKNVGVHVASDALALGNLAGANPNGGAVIIMGEDPWCDSTQVPADSRFICEHLRMPVVEPGGAQELKDWIGLSFKLSAAAGLYIGYIVTTAQADGGGTVSCKPNQFPEINSLERQELETKSIDLNRVLLPPRTWREELRIPARFEATMRAARELGVNRIEWHRDSANTAPAPLGFIATGMAAPYLKHALADLGLDGVFPILRMGMSYPADVTLVAELSERCKQMIVVEERRSFLEKTIRDSLFRVFPAERAGEIVTRMFGKSFPHGLPGIPDSRGLNPSVLTQVLIPLIKATEQIPPEQRHVLPRLPASRQLRNTIGTAQESRRPQVHAGASQVRPGGPRCPWRHWLLHDAHVRPHRTAHA